MAGSAKVRNSDDRYVVFCADGEDYGQPGYFFFTHEADVMMIAAAGEVESGKLTPAEARELLEPYKEVLPPLYTDSQQAVFDPGRRSWRAPDSFPKADDVQQSPQASQIFWYEVDDLGIEGATLVWSEPFPLLAPIRNTAFTRLMKAVSDEYEIVVKRDIDEFDAMGKSVEWARKLIEEAESTAEISYTQVRDPFGVELVYGNSGGRLGLVFLEEDYAEEIRDLRSALRSAATWSELGNMARKKRYRETVEVCKGYEHDFSPNPEDDFDAESLPGYADGNWPEFAPNAMGRWVDEEIIYEYGWYAPTMNGFHPVIDAENEEEVVALLEEQGHVCTRDDDLIWSAVWGG
jgi:hypothetical protein